MKKVLVFVLTITLLLIVSDTNAQIPGSIDGVEIYTSTDYPLPGQSVDVYIESFLFDLGGSSMVWTVDGKTHTTGVGIRRINVTAPKIGIPMNIIVNIKSAEGREVQKSVSLKSSSVDIIWETDGYTPPFFDGKLPFTYQNSVRFTAIPHLSRDGKTEIDPKTLVYTWKRDGRYVENGQGYGIQSVTVPADELPKEMNITVEVYNRENTLRTSGSISLTPGDPSISFYEDHPLYGILFNKALISQATLQNREMKILAVPYSFTNERENTYLWSINNIEQGDLLRNRSITLRRKDDSEGSTNIGVDIRNDENFLQGARGGFTVYFNKNR